MKMVITKGLAGLCILVSLPSCGTDRQSLQVIEDIPEATLVRCAEIPLLKICLLYTSPSPRD